jgi:hypothetical protein
MMRWRDCGNRQAAKDAKIRQGSELYDGGIVARFD